MTQEVPAVTEVADAIWLAEGTIVSFHGFAYPTRSTIIRLAEGDLWVWSPVALTSDVKAEIDRIGPVRHLVSPNELHHLYLADWAAVYPEAKLWGPASTVRKRPDLPFRPPLEGEPPLEWRDQIDQVWFRGSPLLDEIEFHHPPSSTAIIADVSQNFSRQFVRAHWRWWQRPIARLSGIDNGLAPLDLRLSCVRRRAARTAVQRMLSWNPERVVMAHGEWVNANGEAYLRRVFQWI
jgi:Domain of unknown function (DUF4336)